MRLPRALLPWLLIFASCTPRQEGESPAGSAPPEPGRQPRIDVVEALRADQASPRHPSDGAGRAWVESVEGRVPAARAGEPGSWTLVYEAGPLGIAAGGALFLQVSPFWGWSTPQALRPEVPGYTTITTSAAGVRLVPRTLDEQLLAIGIEDRALAQGERVRIVYGAGERGALADRFAERGSRFWIAVDGDGDGVRGLLEDSPAIDVLAGAPAQLLLTLPSTARPGEPVRLTLAVLDRLGNAGCAVVGEVRLSAAGAEVAMPERVHLEAEDGGRRTIEIRPLGSGVLRLKGEGPEGLAAESNPLQVASAGARILWADLQNHSGWSDGTGQPEDLLVYARDVAALDAVALTDHDHWGFLFLDQHPERWRAVAETVRAFHVPGRFVPLLGFEWTSWIHGHRHAVYFQDEGPIVSSLAPATETPRGLWRALAGERVLTFAHHSAGGPIAIDWTIPPDPALEPVTEIVSVHGSSEAPDSPKPIYAAVAGNWVRDALARGYRLGFIGSSDGHDGHPGLGHLASPSGGLAAILSEDLTREGIYEALRARRVYATNGPRILLRAVLGGYPMGAEIPVHGTPPGPIAGAPQGPITAVPPGTLVAQAIAPGELERIDVVRGGRAVATIDCGRERECSAVLELAELGSLPPEAGEFLYLRVVQRDGGAAWSSPFFFVPGLSPGR